MTFTTYTMSYMSLLKRFKVTPPPRRLPFCARLLRACNMAVQGNLRSFYMQHACTGPSAVTLSLVMIMSTHMSTHAKMLARGALKA
jgi:hypothetical protein